MRQASHAYYNEHDPFAAAWLRELIKEGLIADGEVDERSISDVCADDLAGFRQVHFFAGIGGWSYALRLAGIDDDEPVWTGSCPCQPFSAAGKQRGTSDERHLWPQMFRLVRECRPTVVFGEQVEAAIRLGWMCGVRGDLERESYAVGFHVLGAHSVGAPHIRQRLYWVACEGLGNANGERSQPGSSTTEADRHGDSTNATNCGPIDGMEHAESNGREQGRAESIGRVADTRRSAYRVGDASGERLQERVSVDGVQSSTGRTHSGQATELRGHWSESRSIICRDGKQRRVPTQPELFPLAYGVHNRVGTLRGAGNAIVPQVAAEFVKAYYEVRADQQ